MTRRQRQVVDFIKAYWEEHKYAPSYREIAAGLGIRSTSGVNRIILCLEERGVISFLPGKARSVSVTEKFS